MARLKIKESCFVRKLKAHCPDIFAGLERVMIAAHNEQGITETDIVDLQRMMNQCGGALFDGYTQKAPKEKCAPAVWLKG